MRLFRQGSGDPGWLEGQNVRLESRSAENDLQPLPGLAAELVRRRVDDIAAVRTLAATKTLGLTVLPALLARADEVCAFPRCRPARDGTISI